MAILADMEMEVGASLTTTIGVLFFIDSCSIIHRLVNMVNYPHTYVHNLFLL
jgi:hypothetical protein